MKKIALIFTCLVACSGVMAAGNAENGKAKTASCGGCHGADGNSPTSMYPTIAGQHESYLYKQLQDFKAGVDGKSGRPNPIMSSMAAALSDQDMQDISAFYASQTAKLQGAQEENLEAGKKLYLGGNKETGVTACIACHGPKGSGNGPAKFPSLSGQYADYIVAQLKAYQSKTRSNDPNGMMGDIAKKMSDEEMKAVANYISGLH